MTKCTASIAILMATYNGERFLRQQIDSILQQTLQDWHLYVHDDGSKDATPRILREYAANHPDRITILDYPSQGGACRNFMSMVYKVDAPYYMFADQDDVWLEHKVERTFREMKALETPDAPLVISTDLRVVDESLNVLAPTLWAIAGIYPERIRTFEDLAANTLMTGCTMLFNSAARRCIRPLTSHTTMHDAWIACCVKRNGGTLRCIPEQTILYRQHGGNTLGAQDVVHRGIMQRLRTISTSWRINKEQYLMLRDLGYPSVVTFIKRKIRYKNFKIKDKK